jgi:hypothetical protein
VGRRVGRDPRLPTLPDCGRDEGAGGGRRAVGGWAEEGANLTRKEPKGFSSLARPRLIDGSASH